MVCLVDVDRPTKVGDMTLDKGPSQLPNYDISKQLQPDDGPLPLLSKDVVEEILNCPVPYVDEEQKLASKRLVDELSPEDQEIAARSSYAYWVASATFEDAPTEETRLHMAMREARRHLVIENNNYKKARKHFHAGLGYRKKYCVDIFRMCLPKVDLSVFKDKEKTPEILEKIELYRSYILDDLSRQTLVVRGHDDHGRAIVVKMPRYAPTSTEEAEAYVATHFYVADRAFATTEYLSRGKEETVIVVWNLADYISSNSPKMTVMKQVIPMAQCTFPGGVKTIIAVDPPFWAKLLWPIIRQFLKKHTLEKVKLLYGSGKDTVFKQFFNEENAMPFMMAEGKLSSTIDVHQYLNNVLYHCAYDDVFDAVKTVDAKP